jgi:hypothetical protein
LTKIILGKKQKKKRGQSTVGKTKNEKESTVTIHSNM